MYWYLCDCLSITVINISSKLNVLYSNISQCIDILPWRATTLCGDVVRLCIAILCYICMPHCSCHGPPSSLSLVFHRGGSRVFCVTGRFRRCVLKLGVSKLPSPCVPPQPGVIFYNLPFDKESVLVKRKEVWHAYSHDDQRPCILRLSSSISEHEW